MAEETGTCLVTVSGAVTHPGVVEADRGTPLWDIALRSTPLSRSKPSSSGLRRNWVGPEYFATPYASVSLRAIGASAGVGVIAVLGQAACGVAETARIVRYLAGQSAGQCGPCVFGLPAIADDLARLARGNADPGLMTRLQRRLVEVNGRGACRHPDGAVSFVRSALNVFAKDVAAHERGRAMRGLAAPLSLPFPQSVTLT